MSAMRVQVVIAFHQPLTASETQIEAACERGYAPLLDAIALQPKAKVALHFTGHLLDILSRRQPELLGNVKALVASGQAEVLGGLFYGAVPSLLHELDVRGQIEMMAEYWESTVGAAPAGFWLPELAWSEELPRLLDETGLRYGFASSSQILFPSSARSPLGFIECGGHGVAAYVLDPDLSKALLYDPVSAWVDALANREGAGLVTVWARAEDLGLKPGSAERCFSGGWLAEWLQVLGGGRAGIESVLPGPSLVQTKPALPVRLAPSLPGELGACGVRPGAVTWTQLALESPALDVVYRRMLRVSDKLREAIDAMEADGLEDAWSDVLATAQRLVFSAQSPDVCWRGPHQGFADPCLRDAVVDRLCEAEAMIDTLVQGEQDWISAEEADRDGDLVDEIFIANRLLGVWIVPAHGGILRAIDDRDAARNILDVEGAALRERFLPADAVRSEVIGAKSSALLETRGKTEIEKSEIDEEGDGTYHLKVRTRLGLPGLKPASVLIRKSLDVPIDRAELTLGYELETEGAGLVAVEIPVRLAAEEVAVLVNGKPVEHLDAEIPEVETIVFKASHGTTLTLCCEPALDVWLAEATPGEPDKGLWVLPLLRPDRVTTATLKLVLRGDSSKADGGTSNDTRPE